MNTVVDLLYASKIAELTYAITRHREPHRHRRHDSIVPRLDAGYPVRYERTFAAGQSGRGISSRHKTFFRVAPEDRVRRIGGEGEARRDRVTPTCAPICSGQPLAGSRGPRKQASVGIGNLQARGEIIETAKGGSGRLERPSCRVRSPTPGADSHRAQAHQKANPSESARTQRAN